MDVPLEVLVRGEGFNWNEVEEDVRRRAEKLKRYYGDITKIRVVVDSPHRHHHEGKHHTVKIEISTPGKVIVVNRERHQRQSHEDVHVCIRDTFGAVNRKLEEYVRQRRGKVKAHEPVPMGRVASLFPNMDYGFLIGPEGNEVYFHRNSVLGAGFDSLEEGTIVRYNPEVGDEGPQASSVIPLARHEHSTAP